MERFVEGAISTNDRHLNKAIHQYIERQDENPKIGRYMGPKMVRTNFTMIFSWATFNDTGQFSLKAKFTTFVYVRNNVACVKNR